MAKMNDTRTVTCWNMVARRLRSSLRSSFGRPAELARRHNLFSDRFKARIIAQRIDKRINSNPRYLRACVILITSFKPVKRLIFLTESDINDGKAKRRDVALFGQLFQLVQYFQRLTFVVRECVSMT